MVDVMPENGFGKRFIADVLDMVGRDDEMRQIRDAISQPRQRPVVIGMQGMGGIGKTRLIKEALRALRPDVDELDASIIVDFYHMQYHAVDQFIEVLYTTLPHVIEADDGDDFHIVFQNYEHYAAHAQRQQSARVRQQFLEQARQAFVEELRELSTRQLVVLGLDTLERLVYETSDKGRLTTDHAPAWKWIVETLPQWGPVVLLMAGREASESLYSQLSAMQSVDFGLLVLNPLDETQSWQYFNEAAAYYKEHGLTNIAGRIEESLLSDEKTFRPLIYQYTNGRPIFLSLMVDYLALASDVNIHALSANLQEKLEVKDWEEQLINRFMDEIQLDGGDIIRFMGYLPKGADVELLYEVTGIPRNEIALRLAQIEEFSFVKPSGERLFLHDEMYDLFRRYRITEPPGEGPEAEQVEAGVRRYYRTQLEEATEAIEGLYEVIEGGRSLDLQEPLEDYMETYQRLLTDNAYYRLRQDHFKGFRRWYRYVHEATLSANSALDTHLELEMIAFLADVKKYNIEIADELLRIIESTLAIGEVRRAWASENYTRVITLCDEIRIRRRDLFDDEPELEAPLKIWKAYALVVRSQPDDMLRALALLDEAIEVLDVYQDAIIPEKGVQVWLAKVYLGFALRGRGYVRRVQGLMQKAVSVYRHALKMFEQTNVRIEIAYVKNDMGFAQAQIASYSDAIDSISAALAERYELGLGVHIGLSLNTLAIAYTLQGEYDEALRYSQGALNLFRALEHRRGEGLALNAMAEALRRRSGSLRAKGRTTFLEQALYNAQNARQIFEDIDEVSRRVESLIEIGCAHRDWVRLCAEEPRSRLCKNKRIHFENAERTLEEAAELAKDQILYRYVDALVNLAWLHFFDNQLDQVEVYAERIRDTINPGYWFDPATGKTPLKPDSAEAQRSVWTQLAKLHVVRGHTLLQRRKDPNLSQSERHDLLRRAGEAYALAIQYDLLFGADHHGMHKALADIRMYLETLCNEPEAQRAVCQGIKDTESAYDFEPVTQEFLQDKDVDLWRCD